MSSRTEPQSRPLPPYPAESCSWHLAGCFTTSIVMMLALVLVGSSTMKDVSESFGLIVAVYVYPLGPVSILLWVLVVHPLLWGLWSLIRRIAEDLTTRR